MARHTNNEIEHPEAYAAAVKASIYGRANAKRWRAWEAAHPHLAAWVSYHEPAMISHDGGVTYVNNPAARHPLGPVPSFIRDAINKWGAPSEKATEVFQRIFDERTANNAKRAEERAAEAASAQPWTAGRQVVEGDIISVKFVESSFGRRLAVVTKILIKRQDGSKIYLTCPANIQDQFYTENPIAGRLESWLRGKRIRLTVTVEPKLEDPTFAFGSRPSKAQIVEVENA